MFISNFHFEIFCDTIQSNFSMARLIILSVVALHFNFLSYAQSRIERPKLVVGIVVDQMRHEYLYRFYDHYGDDGFKRLMNEGFELKNAHFNYVPTYTGPGHASIYTGTTPRVHGIIANVWYDKDGKKEMYCVEDNTVSGVGSNSESGMRSPKNMLSSTITDELQLFFQNRSKVVGIAIKDRGAILPVGHHPTGAYWYDPSSGQFITSTFFAKEIKSWVADFNAKNLPRQYMKQVWATTKPIDTYVESAADDRPNEEIFPGKQRPTFPYDLKEMSKEMKANSLVRFTPFGNTLTLEMAIAAIDGEQMGQDAITDFLAVSFSSTDYIGHAFGPYSKEVQDTYVRLDAEIARFMNILDEKVGKGNWTLFLTADHGIAALPAYLMHGGQPVDYLKLQKSEFEIAKRLQQKFESDSLIENISNNQIFLNHRMLAQLNLKKSDVIDELLAVIGSLDGIGAVYRATDVRNHTGLNKEINLLAAGYNESRSGDILFTLKPGWLSDASNKIGTTHGSHYSYDTHVPVIFYGHGIRQGRSVVYHPITDIAPTLSMLLNISLPSGATGQPIVELLDD